MSWMRRTIAFVRRQANSFYRSRSLKASLAITLPAFQLVINKVAPDISISQNKNEISSPPPEDIEYSEPRDEDPGAPGLTILVADGIEDVVYHSGKDVVVDIYREGCSACDAYKCTLEQLAYAFEPVRNVVIAKMDGEKNYKKGFLTEEQEGVFPTILLFPADKENSTKPKELKFHFKIKEIINEIYANRKTTWTEQEKEQVLKRAEDYAPILRKKREQFLDNRAAAELWLELSAPCGPEFITLWRNMEMRRFGEGIPEEDVIDASFFTWKKCEMEKLPELKVFWKRLDKRVKDELEQIEEMEQKLKSKSKQQKTEKTESTKTQKEKTEKRAEKAEKS